MSNFDSRFNPNYGRFLKKSRRYYTGIFLKFLKIRITRKSLETHLKLWWHNKSSHRCNDLRLSVEGMNFLINTMKIQSYCGKYIQAINQFSPKTENFIRDQMHHPYFFNHKEYVTFDVGDFGTLMTIFHRIAMYGGVEIHNQNEKYDQQFNEWREKYNSWATLSNFSVDIKLSAS